MYAAALTEDPTVFDYDGVYDSIQEQKTVPKQRDKVTRQPKYIASLLEQAATRKREQDITFERQLVSCSHSAAVGCSCCP
jgi:coiled-coil domain-containing protein 55